MCVYLVILNMQALFTKIVLVFSKIIGFACLHFAVCGHLHVLVEIERRKDSIYWSINLCKSTLPNKSKYGALANENFIML